MRKFVEEDLPYCVSVNEAAIMLCKSKAWIYRNISEGYIEVIKLGGYILVCIESLLLFAKELTDTDELVIIRRFRLTNRGDRPPRSMEAGAIDPNLLAKFDELEKKLEAQMQELEAQIEAEMKQFLTDLEEKDMDI